MVEITAPPSFSPLYRQIKALLTQSLQSGEWKPGEMIPSEMDLAVRYKVSQGTVRKAIDELAQEHLLLRRQGKGTFVATHAEERVQYRFLRLLRNDAQPLPIDDRHFLDCLRQSASAEIAQLLQLAPDEQVFRVRRLLFSCGRATPLRV
jgi:GntR family transcriptional regulator